MSSDTLTDLAARLEALAAGATAAPWRAYARNVLNEADDPAQDTVLDKFLGWELEGPPESMRGQFENGYDALLVATLRNHADLAIAALRLVGELAGESCHIYQMRPEECDCPTCQARELARRAGEGKR